MGDKWTTSGRSRLKAKQNRSFAARAQQQNSSLRAIAASTMNTATNDPHSHPRLRKRNGGVKGSYSTYADPLARRAIAVSMAPRRNEEADLNHPVHPSRILQQTRRRIRDPNQHRQTIISQYNSSHQNNNPTYHQTQLFPPGAQQPPPFHQQGHAFAGVPPFRGQFPPQGRIITSQYQQSPHLQQQQSSQYNDTFYDDPEHGYDDSYDHQDHRVFAHPYRYASDESSGYMPGPPHFNNEHPMQQQQGPFGGGSVAHYNPQNSSIVTDSSNGMFGDDMFQPPPLLESSDPPFARPPPHIRTTMPQQQPGGFLLSSSQLQPPFFAQSVPVQRPAYQHHDEYSFEAAWGGTETDHFQRDGPRRSFENEIQADRRPPFQAPRESGIDIFQQTQYQEPAPNQFAPVTAGLNLPPRGRPIAHQPVSEHFEFNHSTNSFPEFFSPPHPQYRQQAPYNAELESAGQPPCANATLPNSCDEEFDRDMDFQLERRQMRTGPHGSDRNEAAGGIARFQKKSPLPDPPPFDRQCFAAVPVARSNAFQATVRQHIMGSLDAVDHSVSGTLNDYHQERVQRTTEPALDLAKKEESVFQFQTWKGPKAPVQRRPATEPSRLSTEAAPKPLRNQENQAPLQSSHPPSHTDFAKVKKTASSKPADESEHFHDEFEERETKDYPFVRNPISSVPSHHTLRFFNEGVEVDMENRPLSRPKSTSSSTGYTNKNPYLRSVPEAVQRPASSPIVSYFATRSSTERDSDDDLDLAGKTSLWGGKKR